jgi:phage terminase large subunit GpA-like protein
MKKRAQEPRYKSLEEMIVAASESVRPPKRMTVAQAAEEYRELNNPGSFVGRWRNSKTPYLVEPMEELTGLDFTGVVFVGPARTGKSDIFFNWLGYTAICDPADMLLVHMTQTTARDWSQGDLRKVFRHSPEIGKRVTPGKQNLNTYDVKFLSGMRLLVKWPTISELSGKTLPRVFLNDYDRGDEVIEKEGIKWDLASKRTTTYKRHAMTVAESSPGRDVLDPQWLQKTPHEAPPTGDKDKPGGILALYNRGDRRRWQWRCPHCHEPFEPDFHHLSYPDLPDPVTAAEQTVMICPNNGCILQPSLQFDLNLGGRWIKEGMTWNADGSITGTPRRTNIASFWLKGIAAAFTDWKALVLKYLTALREYEATGNEEALRGTITLDQGNAYVPKSLSSMRLPETLRARAEDWGGVKEAPVVPKGARFLIATVDVQARAFVVQVKGFGYGGDIWVVDMFKIQKSRRLDQDGHPLPVDPAAYVEDWDLLIDQVMDKIYPLSDGSGRQMQIKMSACDSGGKEGVTANAYNFYRKLKKDRPDLIARFRLVKGQASKSAPRVMEIWPDSNQRGLTAIARGDVPVYLLNTNLLKDQVSSMLGRGDPGTEQSGGMIHFPIWSPDWFYKQLCAEIRTSKGWENKSGSRNEAFDLTVYGLAVAIYPPINFEKINWDKPPSWADEWDNNDLVALDTITKRFTNQRNGGYDLSQLGEDLA